MVAALILVAAILLIARTWFAGREGYGPPPGAYRARGLYELDSRGWVEYPREYEASTASAISHMIERSA